MLRRIVPAVVATAVIAAGLTGCSAAGEGAVDRGDCTTVIGAGPVSDNTVVLGGFGTAPELDIPSDMDVAVTQRTIVKDGPAGGTVATGNTVLTWNYAFYDQVTGEQVSATPGFGSNDSATFMLMPAEATDSISESLRCAVPGDRVVIALDTNESASLVQGLQLSTVPEKSLIGVFDVVAVSDYRADGAKRGLPSGFPAVVTDADGVPGVVLPPRDAPVGLTSAVRLQGDGEKVTTDDRVFVQMLAVDWEGTVTGSTWDAGNPELLGTEAEAKEQGVNFRAELTGARIGSQLVITEGGENARVYVIDVLAAG